MITCWWHETPHTPQNIIGSHNTHMYAHALAHARTFTDTHTPTLAKDLYVTTHALNEWDSKASGGVQWRRVIDQQRGAVLANELKNNTYKVARWTAETLLAGADQMTIGYVSRAHPKDPYNHVILATQFYKPKEFSTQINLSQTNMWGIFKKLVQTLMAQPEGKYVLMKDPNKAEVMLYSVPAHSFESDDDDDDDDDDEEEDSDEDDE